METLTCSCLKCKSIIGTYDNLWDKIGKTYYSPICWNPSAQDLGGLVTDGEVKAAAKAGVIENSFLQDLACKRCGQKLGIRVDSAPDSHILTKDQLILRIGGMSIMSRQTGVRGSLRVRRKFSLGGPQPRLSISEATIDRSLTPTAYPIETNGPIVPARHALSSFEEKDLVFELLQFKEWARQSIATQSVDISRISGTVSNLEKDMKDFSDFMSETRIDLASRPGGKPWESIKRTVTNLENEVGTLRVGLDGIPTSTDAIKDRDVQLSGEDFDMITESITKISEKVSEIDGLKLELQFLKSKFKRFEDTSKAVRQTMDLTTEPFSGQPSPILHQSPFPTPSQSPALLPQRRAASVSLTPQPRRVSSSLTTDPESGHILNTGIVPQKRKHTDLGLDPLNTILNEVSDLSASATRRSATHKPSRLSHVQLVDENTNPNSSSFLMDRSLTFDGASSELSNEPSFVYESAPEESRPTIRRPVPRQRENAIRFVSPDLSMPPPPLPPHAHPHPDNHAENAPKTLSIVTKDAGLAATPHSLSLRRSQRRAASEILPSRYTDGVLLTRDGKVDQRSLRQKRLNMSWEGMNGENGGKNEGGKSEQGGAIRGEGDSEVQGRQGSSGRLKSASASESNREWKKGNGRSLRRIKGGRILPSIETGASGTGTEYEDSDVEIAVEVIVDAKKKAMLEARERLVRETLEREL